MNSFRFFYFFADVPHNVSARLCANGAYGSPACLCLRHTARSFFCSLKKIVHRTETNPSSMASLGRRNDPSCSGGAKCIQPDLSDESSPQRHNVRTTEGRFIASMFPDAGIAAEVLYMPCTLDAYFYELIFRKGRGVQIRRNFGLGWRVGGREGSVR